MIRPFSCCLAVSLLLAAVPAAAGPLGQAVKFFGKHTDDELAETITKKEARDAARAAGAVGGVTGSAITAGGLLAAAGLSASPIDAEAKAVEQEINAAIESGATVYHARTCLHPEDEEFYTVPKWAEFCADGTKPMEGKAVTLRSE